MSATLTTLIADANGDLYDTTASGSPSNAYVQTNLVSDIAGLATLTDPSLINPWGISRSPHEPVLGFQPRNQHQHSLRGHWRDERRKGERQPAAGRLRRHSDDEGRPAGADRSGQQHQHRLVPVDARHAHHILPFHFRQPERHHFGLGGRPDIRLSWRRPRARSTPASPSTRHRTAFTPPTAPQAASTYSTVRSLRSVCRARSPTPIFPPASSRSTFRTSTARFT